MQVELFGGSAGEWDAFAGGQRGFTHFHRYGWRGIMEGVLGHETIYLAARDEHGVLQGTLALVRVKSMLFGHFLVSMPFLNYGGPLGSERAVAALGAAAVALADRDRVALLELRSAIALPLDMEVSHRKVTVILDLAATAEAQFRAFPPKLRSQVRRPQKAGVSVRFGADQVDAFFSVFSHHMRDLGTPTLPRRFFRAIADVFADDALFACAYLGGQPVAAGCGFRFGAEFELSWASSLRAYNREAPNMLLYWALMERCIESGHPRFNFGRCTPGSGTHTFKLQWGGHEEPLWWYDHTRPGARAAPSHEGSFGWGPRLWRHLPLPVATALGPAIVRYIP